jgi:hypothetical protein
MLLKYFFFLHKSSLFFVFKLVQMIYNGEKCRTIFINLVYKQKTEIGKL